MSDLNPTEARRMAAYVLGIGLDATDREALAAFRLLSAEHHPNNGGDRAMYGAILGAWSTWVGTAHLARQVSAGAAASERVADAAQERAEQLADEPAAPADPEEPADAALEPSFVELEELVEDDVVVVIDLGGDERARGHVEALRVASLTPAHRAYQTAGHRFDDGLDELRSQLLDYV